MNPNRLALIAVLLLPTIAAPDAGAQTRQQRLDQATRHAADQAADEAAQQSADAAAAATEAAAADAADAAADAAAAAADAAREADPYNRGGYDSLAKAVAIFRSRGNPSDERWLQVAETEDERWHSIDLRTVVIEGQIRTAWRRVPKKDGGEFRAQEKFNCASRTTQLIQLVAYDGDGSSRSNVVSQPLSPQSPVPDTIGEMVLDWVCAK